MSRKKDGRIELKVPTDRKVRWCPDPHRRGRIFASKKVYDRKARAPKGSGPSDFPGLSA